ncbi:MAG: 50S ribosomal protein L33 [Proteobacteria bacterium]|nr:50S ribosomal protein L33 [Pseudomonadota bacterium]
MQTIINMECQECKRRNYTTSKFRLWLQVFFLSFRVKNSSGAIFPCRCWGFRKMLLEIKNKLRSFT